MDSELINCMDMLEEELEESKKALFSSSFKKVDTERMYEILEDMRAAYPEELRQAERIISDKMRIMADAKAYDTRCRATGQSAGGRTRNRAGSDG